MENASKALIMAAGVLIGILILSLAVFLFADFGAKSKQAYTQIEEKQLAQYNAQYTVYSGRNDVTIYDIISLANLAKDNNEYYKDYTNYDTEYKVSVKIVGTVNNIDELSKKEMIEKIRGNNKLSEDSATGELIIPTYSCIGSGNLTYHSNGKIASITFRKND